MLYFLKIVDSENFLFYIYSNQRLGIYPMNSITFNEQNQRFNQSQSAFNNFPKSKPMIKANLPAKNLLNKINQKEERKKTMLLGGTALVAGVSALVLSKGFQSATKQGLKVLKNQLEDRLETVSVDNSNKKVSFYESSIRKINSFIKKTESVNNINSVKDILFMKVMYKTNPTKTIHKSISDFFEKISVNTIKSSYKKTQKQFDNMYKAFDNLDEYILKKNPEEIVEYKGEKYTKKELVEKARNYRESVKLVVGAFISENTQQVRYQYIKDTTSELYSKFWDESFKDFWTKDNKFKRKEMWQTFIASEQIKGNKTSLAENVAFARNMLSYTDAEKVKFLSGYIANLNSLVPANDAEGIELMKRIEWFAKDPVVLKDNKEIFLKEIENFEKHSFPNNSQGSIEKSHQKDKDTNIRLIRNIVREDAPGELQDMLDIYYKLAPFELSKYGARKSAQKAVESFDKSVQLEIGEFFDKERDLELGSAPTDVLTMLFSGGMITYGLSKAKSSDEKTSVMLKSGIPIVGAVATSFTTASKLISGSKSIALGLVSGFILNRVGSTVDNYRKGLSRNDIKKEKS